MLYYMCAVEQRLARQAHNLEVVGSIPAGALHTLTCSFFTSPLVSDSTLFLRNEPRVGTPVV